MPRQPRVTTNPDDNSMILVPNEGDLVIERDRGNLEQRSYLERLERITRLHDQLDDEVAENSQALRQQTSNTIQGWTSGFTNIDTTTDSVCRCSACQEIRAEVNPSSLIDTSQLSRVNTVPTPPSFFDIPNYPTFVGLDGRRYDVNSAIWSSIEGITERRRAETITRRQVTEEFADLMNEHRVIRQRQVINYAEVLGVRVALNNDLLWGYTGAYRTRYVVFQEGAIRLALEPEVIGDGDLARCTCCELDVNYANQIVVDNESDTICNRCNDIYFTQCTECDYPIRRDDTDNYRDADDFYCTNCQENTFVNCEGCGDRHPYRALEDGYCYGCRENEEERSDTDMYGIFRYDYKPVVEYQSLVKNKNGEMVQPSTSIYRQLFVGIELEHLRGDGLNPKHYLDMLNNSTLKDKCYYKNDGSLEGQGIELVTHPLMSCGINWGEWREHLGKLRKSKARAYDTGSISCGLHVHTSRSAYTTKYPHAKIGMFLSKCEGQIRSVSKRNDSFERWSKINVWNKKLQKDILKYISTGSGDLPKHYVSDNKYYAVNCNHKNTIEIRIFRGTLDYKGFKASVLFAINFVNFINTVSLTYLYKKDSATIWNYFVEGLCKEGKKLLGVTNRLGKNPKYREEVDELDPNDYPEGLDIDWEHDDPFGLESIVTGLNEQQIAREARVGLQELQRQQAEMVEYERDRQRAMEQRPFLDGELQPNAEQTYFNERLDRERVRERIREIERNNPLDIGLSDGEWIETAGGRVFIRQGIF